MQTTPQRGFTLIELLAVIAIIGILAAIVISNLSSARSQALDARRASDIKNIQLALAQYYNDHLFYPTNIYNTYNSADGLNPAADGLAGAYMSKIPNDPSTNATYPYSAYFRGGSVVCNATNVPSLYHLGAIYQSTNLPTDDAGVASGPYVTNGVTYSPCTGALDFHGESPDCGSSSGSDQCYDVIP